MNRKNIFLYLFLFILIHAAGLVSGQSEIINQFGETINLTEISVTAEPTNIALDDSSCPYVPGEISDYLNCVVANNPIADVEYHLQLSKGDDYLNGVSTIDQVIILRHIAKIEMLTDAYMLVSADVNNDNRINVRDVIELRRLILGIDAEYANSESWRFYQSPNLNVTGIGPETTLNFGGMERFPLSDANITAIKVGDVNNSAIY